MHWHQTAARTLQTRIIYNLHLIHVQVSEAFLNKKLITRWDSERELFYDDIVHALQNNNMYRSIAEVCSHAKIRLAVEFESSSE